ncbi:hypothetical protein OCGS_0267 [Oceaniovalibus guishaninsula JLT2003]|uniref:Small-conductance mechanosensitive channel n=1 Tax=Oceaniovalibus guishaninsula JLT2003 TaxID=1231392 RepID=K2I9N8_9RHOB|nr:mechanosensitive ion channel family protein [Oceaniovalibus guishaninsula]EKE45650.1 hypothetical protein OCGS_0267 [Oceaniovalibus guishaninsula JLT2003]
MRRVRLIALCLIATLAPPPLTAQLGQVPPPAAAPDAPAKVATVPDETIRERVRAIIDGLDGYRDVGVTVRAGIVTLTGHAIDRAAITRLVGLVEATEGVVAVENRIEESTDIAERLDPAIERAQDRLAKTIAFLPLLGIALAAAVAVAFAGVLLARLRQPWERLAPNAFIADIYRQIVRLVFILGGIVVGLDLLNATALLGTFLGAAGLVGLAIGFAVKDTVENFIASVMLSIRQPFAPNDVVEIDGDEGKVIRLTSRATILLSYDGNHIRIPNATVFKTRIVNYTRNPQRRFLFKIGVEADSDLARARKLMEDTITALPYTIDVPGVLVWIEDLNETGAVFAVTGWIDQRHTSLLRARGEAIRMVKNAVERHGFAIPDTTYRIRLEGMTGAAPPPEDKAPPRKVPPPDAAALPEDVPGDVKSVDDSALERFITEERARPETPDLLHPAAPKE